MAPPEAPDRAERAAVRHQAQYDEPKHSRQGMVFALRFAKIGDLRQRRHEERELVTSGRASDRRVGHGKVHAGNLLSPAILPPSRVYEKALHTRQSNAFTLLTTLSIN